MYKSVTSIRGVEVKSICIYSIYSVPNVCIGSDHMLKLFAVLKRFGWIFHNTMLLFPIRCCEMASFVKFLFTRIIFRLFLRVKI